MFTKNKGGVRTRAWRILRLVLLWARKGGVFKRRLLINLHVFGCSSHGRDCLPSMERELSFEKTPIVHVKMHRPHSMRFILPRLPCINPQTDYDFDFERDDCYNKYGEGSIGYYDAGRIDCPENNSEGGPTPRASYEVEATEGIDSKAEEFIAKFYEQIKLQRQISYLEYYDPQHRSSA